MLTRKNILGDSIGEIQIVGSLGNDLTIVNSARLSFATESKVLSVKDEKLIDYLAKNKHTSPFRHCFVSMRIKAPEFVMRQWYKHVIGCSWGSSEFHNHGWNEVSGRYIKMDPEFYGPTKWRKQSGDNKQASDGVHTLVPAQACNEAYHNALEECYKAYELMLKLGTAKEQARMILPLSMYTEVIWTASLQALLNFVSLRDHEHAQHEIREYAKVVDNICSDMYPVSWKALKEHND